MAVRELTGLSFALLLIVGCFGGSVFAGRGRVHSCHGSGIARGGPRSTETDTQAQTGAIVGSVSFGRGTRLPGASITLRHHQTGHLVSTMSGERGVFRLDRLSEGAYELVATLQGFEKRVISSIAVQRDITQMLSLELTPEFRLEEHVTVVGSAPANSLESSEIREGFSQDLGEALSVRTGMWRVRKGGIANDPVLRGLQGRDLTVLVDGQRVYGACPNNMDPAPFHVDFAEVDRVDISKGPFDLRNEGGIGGSLSVLTRRPGRGWGGHVNLGADSFGFLNPSADFSVGGEKVAVLGGFSYRRSDAYRIGGGGRFTGLTNYIEGDDTASAFSVGTGWTKLSLNLSDRQSLTISYARQEADNVLYPYLKMDAEFDDTNRIGFRYDAEHLADRLTRLSVQGYYSEVSHWMTDRFRTSSSMGGRGYSMGTMADTRAVGTKVEVTIPDWTFGLEGYGRFWGAYTELAMLQYRPQYSIPDVGVTGLGLFAEYRRPLSESLDLSAAVRGERVESQADPDRANTDLYQAYHRTEMLSTVDTFASGSARLEYKATRALRLGIGVGSTAEVPEPSERYFALKRKGTDWVGNPGLRRTRNTALDVNFRLQLPHLFLEGGLFHYWLKDFVALYDQPRLEGLSEIVNTEARSYTNTDARIRGAEIAAVVPLKSYLLLSGDLSYVRGAQRPVAELGLNSPIMAEMPPLRSRVGLRFDKGVWFSSVEGIFSSPQERLNDDLGEERTPSWAVLNLMGGIRVRKSTLTLGIQNAFDRRYFEHLSFQRDPFRSGVRIYEPGRRVMLNLVVTF